MSSHHPPDSLKINEPISLIAGIHGSPAELVFIMAPLLHETPDRMARHRDRLLVRHDQDLVHFINSHSGTKELTHMCVIKSIT